MKIINRTKHSMALIRMLLREAGVRDNDNVKTLTVTMSALLGKYNGSMSHKNGNVTVKLGRMNISTLAHELMHVAQVSQGHANRMREAQRNQPYKEQWHEIEARLFAANFK